MSRTTSSERDCCFSLRAGSLVLVVMPTSRLMPVPVIICISTVFSLAMFSGRVYPGFVYHGCF